MSKKVKPTKCLGLMGVLFGHQFIWKSLFSDKETRVEYCLRCGMPQGGWK